MKTSIADAFRELVSDVGLLIRQELKLAQAEAGEKLGQAQSGLIALVVAVIFALCATLTLVQSIVLGLSSAMAPWAAALVTAAALAFIALFAFLYARARLRPLNFTPNRTIESFRNQSEEMKEAMQ